MLWAVDCAYGLGAWEDGYAHRAPLVGPDGAWSAQAFRIRDEFSVLGRVMGPLCRHGAPNGCSGSWPKVRRCRWP